MKLLKNSTRILTIVFSLAALVLFFLSFATIVSSNGTVEFVGTQLAFGGKITVNDVTYNMAKSSDVLLCFILTAVSVLTSALAFTKAKAARWYHVVVTAISAVYMLVMALSNETRFIDTRPLTGVTEVTYSSFVILIPIALFLALIANAVYILADNYLEVLASDEKKLTIMQKVTKFLKDNKGEIKKIVWPGPRSVVKNTIVVLIICAIIGAFIWLLDFGLSSLLDLVWKL